MGAYLTIGPRRGPNGWAPPRCAEIDHRFRTITGFTFCTRCNLPWRDWLNPIWNA